MKTKTIIFLAISAIVTLSFTFASVTKPKAAEATTQQNNHQEPAGGFVSEDKF